MKTEIHAFLVFVFTVILLGLILYGASQLDIKINKIYDFVNNYNLVTIEGFLISIDPNNNWIRFQFDPNYVKIDIKGK